MRNASERISGNQDFIGFRCDPSVKRRVRQEAERRESTITEVMTELVNRELRSDGRERSAVAA